MGRRETVSKSQPPRSPAEMGQTSPQDIVKHTEALDQVELLIDHAYTCPMLAQHLAVQ